VGLRKDGVYVREHIHILMGYTFLGLDPAKQGATKGSFQVDHIDDDKSNNHLSNLEVVTREENQERARKNGRYKNATGANAKGVPRHSIRRFSPEDIRAIRKLKSDGASYRTIAAIYKVDHKAIYQIIKKISYQEL
jgi:hypothetical protein